LQFVLFNCSQKTSCDISLWGSIWHLIWLSNKCEQPEWLGYDHLYVVGKRFFQPEYRIKEAFEKRYHKKNLIQSFDHEDLTLKKNIPISDIIDELSTQDDNKKKIECQFYETASDVPDPRCLYPKNRYVMISDDVML